MEQRLLSLTCHACGARPGEHLFDCHCLLCAACFQETVLADYLAAAALGPRSCRVCQGETAREALDLRGLGEQERLQTLCNCYIANSYLQLRTRVLGWMADAQLQQQRSLAELQRRLEAAREREQVFARFFAWCVSRYHITLGDVDPQLLLRDRERVLMAAFGEEPCAPKAGLNDTKKKDASKTFVLNEVNPFLLRPARPEPALPPSLLNRPFLATESAVAPEADLLAERDSEDLLPGAFSPPRGRQRGGGAPPANPLAERLRQNGFKR